MTRLGTILKVHGIRLVMGLATSLAVTGWSGSLTESQWLNGVLVFVATALTVGIVFRLEVWCQSGAEREVRRFAEGLCRLGPRELSDPQALAVLPRVAVGSAWHSVCAMIQDRLVECGRQADESDHASTACEVRLRRLENEYAQLREILDRVIDPILTINCYDEVEWLNASARELFGGTPGDRNHQKLDTLVTCKPLVDQVSDARRRKHGSHRTAELEIVNTAGNTRWFRVATRPLTDSTNCGAGTHGALAVLTDISSEKEIQRRHAEFVSSAAHELKTPLASIRAYVELLQDGEASDEATQEEFLEVISSQAQRLQRLIENLLNIARIEAGVVKVEKHNWSLNEVLEQALHVVQPAAGQKPLQLVNDLSPLHLGVFVDRDMALQAAINLLSNAVKYTPAQGTVTLRSRLDDHAAIFEVEDTGVGLSPEDCQKVFERFYRVKKDQQMAPGTGLGLALVKHIVEDVHGGTIAVASQLGKGSVFRVTLPVVSRSRA